MATTLLVFFGPLAFGFLVGLAAGLSTSPGTGRALVTGLLGTGVLSQLIVFWMSTGSVDLTMIGLLGFAVGGVAGLAIGVAVRRAGGGIAAKGARVPKRSP